MRILIASSIHPPRIEELKKEHDVKCAFNAKEEELKSAIYDREVLIFRSGVQITAEVMEAAPNLELLIRAGSGVDNIDMDYVKRRGLKLVRVPQPGAKAVSEMAFAMMLDLARNVLKADRLLRRGEWAKTQLTGYLLTGKTLGVVGCGNIGTRVGMMGAAWGMDVIACIKESHPEAVVQESYAAKGVTLATFDEVISRADFVSIHVPLDDSTRYLFTEDVLSRMKKGAYLVNLARGGVVNEAALYKALTSGHLAGAATDVHENEGKAFRSPFIELDNVVLTPHIGAQTYDSQREIGERVSKILAEHVAESKSVFS